MKTFPEKIEISHRTIIFTLATLATSWILLKLLDVIFLIFIAFIFVSTLRSPVDFLVRRKIPRPLSIGIIYLVVIGLIILIFRVIIPPLIEQTSLLIENLPSLINQVNDVLIINNISSDQISGSITGQLGSFGSNAVTITAGFFNSIFSVMTMFVITFYSLLYWEQITNMIKSLFTGENEKRAEKLIKNLEFGLGAWVRGQITLVIIIGVITYIGLALLGVPYALPLAIVAGLSEIVPVIGPIVGAIPAILAGFTVSPIIGIATVALYFVIQQLENNLIVPSVMRRAIGINPLVTILALIIGTKLYGIMGAVLAVPVAVTIKIFVNEFFVGRLLKTKKD
ncbi:AI-2E family transporter [Candidatus Curtissbacteria bacterium]|mgnify:CR=1 FL=1|nr:AI-2E family transporter [Candidatus Curtissbacteria bacterium]